MSSEFIFYEGTGLIKKIFNVIDKNTNKYKWFVVLKDDLNIRLDDDRLELLETSELEKSKLKEARNCSQKIIAKNNLKDNFIF
jgi:hypothetical protein